MLYNTVLMPILQRAPQRMFEAKERECRAPQARVLLHRGDLGSGAQRTSQ
jgi:hypothetical protein